MKNDDPHAELRKRVHDLMVRAGKGNPRLKRDLARLPESQLQFLYDHYSPDAGPRCVW